MYNTTVFMDDAVEARVLRWFAKLVWRSEAEEV